MAPESFRILFVCTGNVCRSPMAEALLKQALQKNGIRDIEVESAGTMAPVGMAPTTHALAVMAEEGIDFSAHRARFLTKAMIAGADLILVMEKAHRIFISQVAPEAENKTVLIKGFGGTGTGEVPDPIGGDEDLYRQCRDTLQSEIDRILPDLLERRDRTRTAHS